jgi:hypothetical protein
VRIPWSAPTVSDATKLGLVGKWDTPDRSLLGSRLYRLLYQVSYSTDWPDATNWSEVDADGKVNLSGGIWSMDGGGAFNTHGVYKTTGVACAHGYFEVKYYCTSSVNYAAFSCALSAALVYTYMLSLIPTNANSIFGTVSGVNAFSLPLAASTWYTLRIYITPTPAGLLNGVRGTIQGGAYANETKIVDGFYSGTWGATLYPGVQRYASDGANLAQFKEFRWYSGYATNGPTLSYVADAGAGKLFNGLVFTNLAAVGAWATTNATFAYDFSDSATPSFSAEKTLAQLNALAALTTNKRYIHLRVTVNSNGATQQYAGELNADDGTAAVFALPAAGDILTGVTINTVAGDTSNLTTANAKFQSLESDSSRNQVVTPLSAVPSPANGGPAAWNQLGVSRVGTGDKKWSDAELASANTAYENGRNDPASLTNAKLAASAGAVKIKGTTYSGSADLEAHTAEEVVKSAGGDWDDTELQVGDEGNVKKDIEFGLDQVGTFGGVSVTVAQLKTGIRRTRTGVR